MNSDKCSAYRTVCGVDSAYQTPAVFPRPLQSMLEDFAAFTEIEIENQEKCDVPLKEIALSCMQRYY